MSTTANVHLNASPVVIVGGGPVGMTLAALLAHYGIRTVVIEADAGYCDGSRAICVSRRSQESFIDELLNTSIIGSPMPRF